MKLVDLVEEIKNLDHPIERINIDIRGERLNISENRQLEYRILVSCYGERLYYLFSEKALRTRSNLKEVILYNFKTMLNKYKRGLNDKS